MLNNPDNLPLFTMAEITEAVTELKFRDATTVLSAIDKIAEQRSRTGRLDDSQSQPGGIEVFEVYMSPNKKENQHGARRN